MKSHGQAIKWTSQYLTTYINAKVIGFYEMVQTSYSVVYAIETNQGVFYLKIVPKALFIESKLLQYFQDYNCKNTPKILLDNHELQCFLMSSSGDESLRNHFKGKADLDMLKRGISNYTRIQRRLEADVSVLLSLGLPDWRLEKFPSLYNELLRKQDLLLEDGLTKKEIKKLNQLYPNCVKLCSDLSKYGILETINHCDFHENNMLLDRKRGEVNIIDWGETVITHPFFFLNGCLWNIVHFNDIKKYDSSYHELQSQCVDPWLDVYNKADLLEAFSIADQLNGIYAALGYEKLYIATEGQHKSIRKEHPGSIAGCLRTFGL